MKNFWERLDDLIIESTGGNDSQFEDKSKLSRGYIRKTINFKRNMKPKFIKSILDNHPNINPDWLINGYGDMFKSSSHGDAYRKIKFDFIEGVKAKIIKGEDVEKRDLITAFVYLDEELTLAQQSLKDLVIKFSVPNH